MRRRHVNGSNPRLNLNAEWVNRHVVVMEYARLTGMIDAMKKRNSSKFSVVFPCSFWRIPRFNLIVLVRVTGSWPLHAVSLQSRLQICNVEKREGKFERQLEKMSSSVVDGMRGCFFQGGKNQNGWLLQKTLINSNIPTAAVHVKTSFGILS